MVQGTDLFLKKSPLGTNCVSVGRRNRLGDSLSGSVTTCLSASEVTPLLSGRQPRAFRTSHGE